MTQGSLARRLRVLRAERGLTLREAASLTGVAKETISDIERGLRHPHDPTLAKIAKGYSVPVQELLEEPQVSLAGKAEAPQAGRAREEQRQRLATLEEIREAYRETREGIDRYCDSWERRFAGDDLDRELVREFLDAAAAFLPALRDSLVSELIDIAPIVGVAEDDGVSDEMRAASVMIPAFERYCEIGRKLEAVWRERFTAEPGATDVPVIDFEAKRQELWRRRAG
jgi:transcriptional regulator with XRE-family HTH domain